jgi:hypothetical protein
MSMMPMLAFWAPCERMFTVSSDTKPSTAHVPAGSRPGGKSRYSTMLSLLSNLARSCEGERGERVT